MVTQHSTKYSLPLSICTQDSITRGEINNFYQGQSIDDVVIQYMTKNKIPGLSVSIVQAPYITRVVGYGVADQTTKRLIGSHTLFYIGQMTTAYTAVAIMQLYEDKKLGLDDIIGNYLSDIPQAWTNITIRELLTHTSGLPSYIESKEFSYSTGYNKDQIIALVKNQDFNFKTGTNSYASATDYYLLAAIIEKASAMSYDSFVKAQQFERMGLRNTYFLADINKIPNELKNGSNPFKHSAFKNQTIYINPAEPATGYINDNGVLKEAQSIHPSTVIGYASILSTAEDISIWDVGLAGDILIKDPKNREFVYNSVLLNSGEKKPGNAGWNFPGHPGFMYIQGNVPGFSSHLSRYTAPNELLCVTVLANKDNLTDLTTIARQIAGAYNSTLTGPASAPWSVATESPYSVDDTIERLRKVITSQGGTIFAEIDHAANALKAKQTLSEVKVLIIGNPSKGTDLMKGNMSMSLDLPLRIAVWLEEATKEVWVAFTDPIELAQAYQIEDQDALLTQIHQGLTNAVRKATSSNFVK